MFVWKILWGLFAVTIFLASLPGLAEGKGDLATQDTETDQVFYIGRPFPGEPVTGGYLRSQQLFDAYYAQRRYGEAHEVLVKGLVWRGDKHAQYMLGVMYWFGQGVPLDRSKGAAWFRLSAQRGNTLLMQAKDEAWQQLTPGQVSAATAYYEQITEEFGDLAVIKRLMRRDGWTLNRSMVRHPTAKDGNMDMLDGSGITQSGTQYSSAMEARMQERLDYLNGYVEYGELELIDNDRQSAAAIEQAEQSGD